MNFYLIEKLYFFDEEVLGKKSRRDWSLTESLSETLRQFKSKKIKIKKIEMHPGNFECFKALF